MNKKYKRHLITAALPYANGPIHIGHLAGCYIPADIYVRYLRLKGEDVKFVCGSDEHGVPITIKARNENSSPQQVVDKYHAMMKKSFEDFGISFDIYSRTSSPVHHQTASDFFKTLYEKKVFEEITTQQYYDEEAKQFLADRYIAGTCPRCGFENAYGDQCENCGTSLQPTDLINPRSKLSGAKPVMQETKNWYLPLNKYGDEIKKWIESHRDDWKPNVFGQCMSWLNEGLKPRAMTRDLNWGVKVPLPDTEGKVLYVWFDAPIGYISATKELFNYLSETNNEPESESGWKKYWMDAETKLVHFIGKDNIVFHCIIFPAMLKAHGGFILPENVPANEFLNLEGDKISTSRNWAVWLHEYLEEFPGKQDVLRYVLCATAPENKDNDFTWKDFQARNNSELVAILGNFVNRVFVLIDKYYNGLIPEPSAEYLNKWYKDYSKFHKAIIDEIDSNLKRFKFRDALQAFFELPRVGNSHLSHYEPWKKDAQSDDVKTSLYLSIQLIAQIAIYSQPFLPSMSKQLSSMLNIDLLKYKWGEKIEITAGSKLNSFKHLFHKIEDDAIEKQIQKLHATKKANVVTAESAIPNPQSLPDRQAGAMEQKPPTTFDEFSRMDIRIGTILEAERVPKTDKLLKLKIDTGIDQRTVVSGIAKDYKPEKIIGQQVCILVNLEPRKIKGIESKGMILMAENESGELAFISPTKKTSDGGIVK